MPPRKTEQVHAVVSQDERFYNINGVYLPRITTILEEKSKGIGFYKWLAGKGWDESQEIVEAAGKRGTNVHQAIEYLVHGGSVRYGEVSTEEYDYLMDFKNFWEDYKPKVLKTEYTVYSFTHGYAGTIDCIATITDKKTGQDTFAILDWKTSGAIYSTYNYQLAAYGNALREMEARSDMPHGIIVRIGASTKRGYQLRELDPLEMASAFEGFKGILASWKYEHPNAQPKLKERPSVLVLDGSKADKSDAELPPGTKPARRRTRKAAA